MEIRVESGDGRISLEFLPQIGDDDECGHRTGQREAQPHEPFANRPTFFGNVAHTVECGILEKLPQLVLETEPKQSGSGQTFRAIARPGLFRWIPGVMLHTATS